MEKSANNILRQRLKSEITASGILDEDQTFVIFDLIDKVLDCEK